MPTIELVKLVQTRQKWQFTTCIMKGHSHRKTIVKYAGAPALLDEAPLQELAWVRKLGNVVAMHQLQTNTVQSAASLRCH